MQTTTERFRELLEFAPDAIIGVDTGGRIVLANAQTETLFGYRREDLMGQLVEILVPDGDREAHPRHRDGYFRHPRTRPMGAGLALHARRADGGEFPVEISLSSIDTQQGKVALAAIRDVSERERARRRFEQLLQFAPDAIVGAARDGRIVLVNAQAESVFGYERDELLGQPVELLVPERFRGQHGGHRAHYFDVPGTRPMGAELNLFGLRKDGSEFPAEISLSSLETEDGIVATVAVRDISDRVRIEAEQRRLEKQLAEVRRLEAEREKEILETQLNQLRRLESVGQLAGGIAHDFNNILAIILNYARFAMEEMEPGSPAMKDVEGIYEAAERAASLTHQLLIFSRRDVTRVQVLDVNAVVAGIEPMLRRTLGEHISLSITPVPGVWSIEADPGQIEQVLVNLVVNARDAMPSGGQLTIETANVDVDEEFVSMHPGLTPGSYVQLSVSDTGLGMEPDVVAHAFEPFYTTKPAGEGTGLGLATVYGIVSEAGGSVRLYSEPGVGTTARIFLPVSHAPMRATPVPVPAPRAGRGERVLIVEDEPEIRAIAERILVRGGYRPITAADGGEALDLLEQGDPVDLLLTDIVMPRMLGPDLAAQAQSRQPGLRVLFMSGYLHQMLARTEADVHGFGLVEKPFTAESLLGAVGRALGDTMPPAPEPPSHV